MRALAWPYMRPSSDAVRVVNWQVIAEGRTIDVPLDVPGTLPGWDPVTPLQVRVEVETCPAELRAATGGSPEMQLALVLAWRCPQTSLRGLVSSGDVPDYPEATHLGLLGHLEGSLLASEVLFDLMVVLVQPDAPDSSLLVATAPGSILWQESRKVLLEGIGARFPMEWADFTALGSLPPKAAWALTWQPHDLRQEFSSSTRLYLNSSHPTLSTLLERPDTDEARQVLSETIRLDVGRTLILGALQSHEITSGAEDFPDGTVGKTILRLIRTLFPKYSIPTLRSEWQQMPDRFEALLQERLQFLVRS